MVFFTTISSKLDFHHDQRAIYWKQLLITQMSPVGRMYSKMRILEGISQMSYLPQFHTWTFSNRAGSKVLHLTSARILAQHTPVRVYCICFGQLENKTWKQILLESLWQSHRAPCPSCWQIQYFSLVYSHCGFHWPAWHGFPRSLRRPVHRPLACIIFSTGLKFSLAQFHPITLST